MACFCNIDLDIMHIFLKNGQLLGNVVVLQQRRYRSKYSRSQCPWTDRTSAPPCLNKYSQRFWHKSKTSHLPGSERPYCWSEEIKAGQVLFPGTDLFRERGLGNIHFIGSSGESSEFAYSQKNLTCKIVMITLPYWQTAFQY